MADEGRSVVFGRDPVAYENARPSYPPEAIEYVRSLVDAKHAVEIGAGTGKATASMAREDLDLTCLEPSPQMADLLREKRLVGVTAVVSTFEAWEGESASTDLIYAAQSWHWVDGAIGFGKALTILRAGGALALMWNIPLDRYARHEAAYRRHAPQLLDDQDVRIRRRDSHDWSRDMDEAGFVDTEVFTHEWSEELTTDLYRTLYSSYSDHIMLEESVRTRLLDALAADVERWGGTAKVDYRTRVFSGRKPDTDRR